MSLGAVASGTNVKVSTDGQTVVADTVGLDGIKRASYWRQATGWVQLPGIGGTSGGSETSVYAVNADGTVITGLGWTASGSGHAFRWTASTGTSIDLTPPFSQPASRGNDINGAGDMIVGWQDSLSGQRLGCRWLNGVKTSFTYTDPNNVTFSLGEALATNTAASVVVGYNVFGLPGVAWRWSAGTNTVATLTNLPGETSSPIPTDVSDDGTMAVGIHWSSPFDRKSVLWLDGQPTQSLYSYLLNLGAPIGTFTDLGTPFGISRDGRVIVGRGSLFSTTQPQAWVIEFTKAGVPFCAGDGISTDHTTPCPCTNNGAVGNGCANSANAAGGKLDTTGGQPTDDVVLVGTGMPASVACIYLQGDVLDDTTFGDGVRCCGGTLLRLRTKINVGGASSFPDSVETVTLSQRGGVTPGSGVRRYYQTYYRNAAAGFCPPETFNVTNGVYIDW
ncbi:MAG: hypothetical protein IPJ77_04865 [Planctomycetes bacterium]|nr:hypothetical protein [Planctomycetota bacterium]